MRKKFGVFVLSVSVLLILGCDWFGQGDEKSSTAPREPPVTLTEEEFRALSHLDEHPVREEREVAVVMVGTRSVQRPIEYVHCNLGWSGYKNGWYASGIFDINKPVVDGVRSVSGGISVNQNSVTVGEERNYQYNIQIISYLQPNYN
jgi:hypothetical protein